MLCLGNCSERNRTEKNEGEIKADDTLIPYSRYHTTFIRFITHFYILNDLQPLYNMLHCSFKTR